MKYENTTQEQKDGMTPCLNQWFEFRKEYELYSFGRKHWQDLINGFQQAQKEKIKFLKAIKQEYSYFGSMFQSDLRRRLDKLKFESELE